jgi:eukaryotic-like serine/threonine-protein kinase
MSPEQALGQKVDSRSDLFSVGVVLFHLVTGQRPFEADSLVTLMYRIAKEEPKPLEKLRGDLPPSLRRIITRCLKKQPEKRYQSGAELAEALGGLMQELNEQARESGAKRIVPLRVKWTLSMAAVVALTMAITSVFVTQRQHAALMTQVLDYGASLSRFMATESAVPVLSEDWIAIDIFVQEVMKTQDFRGITVVDHTGVVRASSNPQLVGRPHADPAGEALPSRDKSVKVIHYKDEAGVDTLDFQTPITFQGKSIGHAHLMLPEAPLSKVNRLTYAMMLVLLVVTVLAVTAATYILADRSAKPIRVLRKAMRDIARGKYERRIEQKRNDEFGLLFQSFDEMAAALQEKADGSAPPPSNPG